MLLLMAHRDEEGSCLQIRWTKLPFPARSQAEFDRMLPEWLSRVFYEELPAHGFEVREEQIYTAFRMARALTSGKTLFAEAGPGTGKTFAYLLPAICYARFRGRPVVVASASGVLQAQLTHPEGDIQTLSRILNREIDARVASDPAEYICEVKVGQAEMPVPEEPPERWDAFRRWAQTTGTGARAEVPDVPDELWELFAFEPSLPCDTCSRRGHCHVMTARRHYRSAADLVICDHALFCRDLLTRAEREEEGLAPLLPAYAAVVLDEGHHVPEVWQRTQGYALSRERFQATMERVELFTDRAAAERAFHGAVRAGRAFFRTVLAAAAPGEGKRDVDRGDAVIAATVRMDRALEALQDELATEEAMHEGLDEELQIRAYQARLDEMRAALRLFGSADCVPWVEGDELWVVPRRPLSLTGPGRLPEAMPLIFSSATLEPEYQGRVLGLPTFDASRVGVPFQLGEQVLLYQPEPGAAGGGPVAQTVAVLRASGGRALVLLRSQAEVQRYKEALAGLDLPWPLLFEGDGDRGAMLERFRHEVDSVLFGSTFWEGVDVPGEALSCCVIPALPFPEHDPLIRERRTQAEAQGLDPFTAVDLPEMLIRLKQAAGRLIRTAQDRGVLALLDRSWEKQPWAEQVEAALPEDAESTGDLGAVAGFLTAEGAARMS